MGMLKEKEIFIATDGDGCEETIIVYQEIIRCPTRGNPMGTIEGMMRAETASGEPLNWVDDDTYETIDGARLLIRKQPNA